MPQYTHYTLKYVTTPLPSQSRSQRSNTKTPRAATKETSHEDQSAGDTTFYRAENEDDDGYDPYSDQQERVPLFEEDPWN